MLVSVVYALPDCQFVRELVLAPGATVTDALLQSGLTVKHPETADEAVPVGIHGHCVARDAVLQHGDRVEIYRPLRLEPKEARRRRLSKP